MKPRVDQLSALLDHAFGTLLEISEWPNRTSDPEGNREALKLALMARAELAHIERRDPDKGIWR